MGADTFVILKVKYVLEKRKAGYALENEYPLNEFVLVIVTSVISWVFASFSQQSLKDYTVIRYVGYVSVNG